MVKFVNILILGGDKRQIYLTELLKCQGYNAEHILSSNRLKDKIKASDVVVLPLPATKDKITVFNAISEDKIYLSDIREFIDKQMILSCKMNFDDKNCIDYSELDTFAIKNAVPTAEGAISIAIKESEKTIFKSNCLVIGNGRIGKILSQLLKQMGANVTVSARRESDIAFIEAFNMNAVHTADINNIAEKFDYIFNTVDFPVIDSKFLEKVKSTALLIELASLPGGINGDKDKAKCKIINAQGLPGKFSPFTAAEILSETIISILSTYKGEIL